ncbi:4628_t:CDS:2, partial [Diversispora eburnea]
YLITLKNFSKENHIGEMLANEIAIIIEKIDSEKFVAIVIDAVANCRILSEHSEIITNLEIIHILKDEDFFSTCRFICHIWEPIKERHSDNSCKELLLQLRCYEAKLNPFDLAYTEIDTSQISNEINDDEMETLDYNPEDIINNFLFDELNEKNDELELNEMELNKRNDEIESN